MRPAEPSRDDLADGEALSAASPFGIRFVWDDGTGRLAGLRDLGMRRRGLSAVDLASEFLRTYEGPLSRLTRISDREEFTISAVEPDEDVTLVEARHTLDGVPVLGSQLLLYVSGPAHYFGPGLLLEVLVDLVPVPRDLEPPVDLIPAEEIPVLAELALLDAGRRDVDLGAFSEPELVVCCTGHTPCHYAWMTSGVADGVGVHVEIDAYGGEVMDLRDLVVHAAGEGDLKYWGPVAYDQDGHIPLGGPDGDVELPWMYGSIWDYCSGETCWTYITDTDSDGHYDGDGGNSGWWIGMVSREQSGGRGRVERVKEAGGEQRCDAPVYRSAQLFTAGDDETWTWGDAEQRIAGLGYYWMNYGISAYEYETLEVPELIKMEVTPGGGTGSEVRCEGDIFHVHSMAGGGDDYRHYVWTHELGHTVLDCATDAGAGCVRTGHGYRFEEAFSEGGADLSALWLTKGRHLSSLGVPYRAYTPDYVWGGSDTAPGDDYIDDYELVQRPCAAGVQCASGDCRVYGHPHIGDPGDPGDDVFTRCYCADDEDCEAGETCHNGWCRVACAHGDHQACRDHFSMDSNVYCYDNGADDFCWFHAYFNNRMLVNAWNRFRLHVGWERGIRYVYKAMAGVDETTTFQEDAASHYEKLRAKASWEKLEAARAFASVKPTFSAWPDDLTTNYWVASHIRSDGTNYEQAGLPLCQGCDLQFNYAGDTDYVGFRARPGESYRVWVDETAPNVDACLSIYEWSSAHTLVARDDDHCFDWVDGGSDLTWAGSASGGWYQVRVSNQNWGTGAYRLRIEMVDDDHADWGGWGDGFQDAEPIAHEQWVYAENVGESDYFKVYVPDDPAITEIEVTAHPGASLYLDWGGTEDAWPQQVDQGWGVLAYELPPAQRGWYYVYAGGAPPGWLFVQLRCGAQACDGEDDFGARMAPYHLGLDWGNTIAQRLHDGADEDWYSVDLEEAEHLSVNAYGPDIYTCRPALELYADEEQPYYNCDGTCSVPSLAGTPQYLIRQVGFGANYDSSNLHLVSDKAGTYYVRVTSGDGQACSAYVLSVGKTSFAATQPLWDYQEPGF